MFLLDKYLVDPTHDITISLIGCGGTGSHLFYELCQLNEQMRTLINKGFKITLYDDDIVESHNIGRQRFYVQDIGEYKAQVLSERANFIYGNISNYRNEKFTLDKARETFNSTNIYITCTDTISSRLEVGDYFFNFNENSNYSKENHLLWIDVGNDKNSGQIILSDYEKKLKSFLDYNPDPNENENISCSAIESLTFQNYTINRFMALTAVEILSELLINKQINYSMVFLNRETMQYSKNKI